MKPRTCLRAWGAITAGSIAAGVIAGRHTRSLGIGLIVGGCVHLAGTIGLGIGIIHAALKDEGIL